MTNTYTISNTTGNAGTVTLDTGAGVGGLTNQPLGNITIANGGISGAGQIFTTNGTGISNWATSSTQLNGSNGKPVMSMPHGKDEVILEKDVTLRVKGKVVINDRDLEERLSTMEKLLQIPERDVKLEAKHPKLKKLYNEYIAALGKYRTFEAIKGEDE